MDSGFRPEPVIGPRFARTRWAGPGMTKACAIARILDVGAGCALVPSASRLSVTQRRVIFAPPEGSGAPGNAGACEAPWAAGEPPARSGKACASRGEERRASRRSTCGDFCSRRRTSGRKHRAGLRPARPGGFRRLSFPRTCSHRRQTLVVGPDGLAGTSRARGYEPHARAPHRPRGFPPGSG